MLIPGTVHDLNIQCLLYICLQFTVIRVHVIFFVNESLGGPTMKIAYRWQGEVLWAISRLPSLFWSLVDQQYQCMFDIWNSTNQPTKPTSQPLNLSTNQLQTWVMHEHRSQSLLLSLSTLCRQSPGPTGASSATSKEDASMLQFHQGTFSVTLKIHGTFLCMNITGWMMNASSTEFLSLFATLLLKWWRPPERWVNWKLLPHLSSQKPDLGRLPQTRHRWISDGGDHATSLIRDGFKN